ncbi:hypothetical protein GCM10009725_27390 [Aeromicrobium tamlense]
MTTHRKTDEWSKHYRGPWIERAHDPRHPKWLRVASHAYGTHKRNGHAPLGIGELADLLARVDSTTGEFLPDMKNAARYVAEAVDRGWLAAGSNGRCLIVPSHAVEGGTRGSIYEQCSRH